MTIAFVNTLDQGRGAQNQDQGRGSREKQSAILEWHRLDWTSSLIVTVMAPIQQPIINEDKVTLLFNYLPFVELYWTKVK